MKIDRLLGIIHILMQKEKVTAPYLADLFEVSRRTISRDIDAILMAGIPIMTEQGYHGGIWLDDRYKLDKALLTKDEMETIFASLKGMDSISDHPYTEQIKRKLSFQEEGFIKDDIIWIDLASYYKGELSQKISLLKQAIWHQHSITFSYMNERGTTFRKIDPQLLTYRWSSWYVVGFCHLRNEMRMFKLNRLWNLVVCEETCLKKEIPQHLFASFSTQNIEIKLCALFQEHAVYRVIDEYGIDHVTRQTDGRYLFIWNFQNENYLYQWIASFGSDVEVLAPVSLKDRLIVNAEKILQLYKRQDI